MTYTPTPEQANALALFATGESLVIEAGAGAGKTSTLRLLAESTPRTGTYLAYNKAIVVEAGAKMPGNVTCSTAHGLAYRAVGHRYARRLNAPRMKAAEQARRLGIDALTVETRFGRKRLAPGFLAGVVNRAITRFCQTADTEVTADHFDYLDGIDLPTPDGRPGWANNRNLRAHLLPAARRLWLDLTNEAGALRFSHDHYLKIWQLSGPRIDTDFLLFDEAQDANPVMLAIVAAQHHAQRVYVGDSQQAIYGFTGAVNALAAVDVPHRAFLTQSFRFGPDVAGQANIVLRRLDAELVIKGTPTIASTVGPVARPDVILSRTNAAAVTAFLNALDAGQSAHIVGGATEVLAFARGAQDLAENGWTSHPELACFDSWPEVVEYVTAGEDDGDLRLLVTLVETFTAPVIVAALARMTPEQDADVVLSTAHKAKGREWDSVALADDFPNGFDAKTGEPKDVPPEELRLVYVAITRARRELDLGPAISTLLADDGEDAPAAASAASDLAGVTDVDVTAWVDHVDEAPAACPMCGSTDAVRPSGSIGPHACRPTAEVTKRAAAMRCD